MNFSIDTKALKVIVESVKDQLLLDIPDEANLLISINERGVNHGVMQFYYSLLIEISEYEKEQILRECESK